MSADELLRTDVSGAPEGPPLRRLLVNGLLSFGEETTFQFGRLNVLVGPNGSGKSNLVDCLRIFRYAPYDIQETFRDSGFEDWLFRGKSRDSFVKRAYIELDILIPGAVNEISHKLRIGPPIRARAEIDEIITDTDVHSASRYIPPYFAGSGRGTATLSVQGSARSRRERELDLHEYNPFQSILSQIRDAAQFPEITRLANLYSRWRIYSEWSFGRSSNLREATSAGRSDTTLSETMDDLALTLNALENTDAHDRIRSLLHELKDTYRDYVTRILFGRVGLELVESPFETPLPAKRLSDGTLRFLAMASILLQPSPPPVICLEEPELGMHPDMIRVVAGMIVHASSKSQLIVTTHSEHLLSALEDDIDVVFAFNSGLHGTVVRSFSRQEFDAWRTDHSLGELWSSGELGGNRW